METPPPTVEQRHRNAAADLIEQRGEWLQAEKIRQGRADKSSITVQAFARFDTERTAELEREIAALRGALRRIEQWEMPATGREWEDGTPMSYSACFGWNGERAYVRNIARNALGGQP